MFEITNTINKTKLNLEENILNSNIIVEELFSNQLPDKLQGTLNKNAIILYNSGLESY
jgi:hypothetical protein